MGAGTGFGSRNRVGLRLTAACLIVGLALSSVAGLPVGVAGAATQTVTNCNDSGAGSLRQAVATASSGDTVAFALSPSCSTIALTSPIDIAMNLTIAGPGPGSSALALSAGGATDDVDVSSAVTDASISGLTVEDGSTGIHNDGSLTVTDCTMSNNTGGISNDGTLSVTDSTLSDNITPHRNGLGGGGIENQGSATVDDSTFLNNRAARGVDGGAMANYGGSLSVTDSTVSDNHAGRGFGGAIFTRGGTLTISDSTLSGNSSFGLSGGAIDNEEGMVTVSDSTLSGNSTLSGTGGGAIYSDGVVDITNSTLAGNSAPHGDGGAITNTGTLTVTHGTLAGNSARHGGAIFTDAMTTMTASLVAESASGGDCSGTITDGGYKLDDDGSCGLTAGTDLSDTPAGLDPAGLQTNGGPTDTIGLEAGSPAIGAVTDASLCSTPDQRGVARPTPCDIGAVQLSVPPQAFTSPDTATTTAGTQFSFVVTTSGTTVPSIKKSGKLPKHLSLVDNGDGTATISGKAVETGTYHLSIMATFGAGKTRSVVTQKFTLTVGSA